MLDQADSANIRTPADCNRELPSLTVTPVRETHVMNYRVLGSWV
jgi:hypothetical protein